MSFRTPRPLADPSIDPDRAGETVATVSSTHLCACGCGQPITPGTRGEPKRFATSRCRARAWDRAHPRLKAEPQVHPFLAEIDTILLGRTEAKREPGPHRGTPRPILSW